MWKLLNKDNEEQPMDTVFRDFRGEEWLLRSANPPHKPSSSGAVYVGKVNKTGSDYNFYPSVVGLKWVWED
jgi:hypothetical protein